MTTAGATASKIDLAALKAGGIIAQCQADLFAVRLRIPVGDLDSTQMARVAEIAQRYGRGRVHITVRQGIEIPYVHFDHIDAAVAELATVGLELGACGPRVRVVTGCQGADICRNALAYTQAFGKRLDAQYFGRSGVPHKVKIGVTGCPRACAKPQENDIGFTAVAQPVLDEADGKECIDCGLCARICPGKAIEMVEGKPRIDYSRCFKDADCVNSCPAVALRIDRRGWDVYVCGRWGRRPALGVLFAEMVSEEEAFTLVESILTAYSRLGVKRERMGVLIDRIGMEAFREEVARA